MTDIASSDAPLLHPALQKMAVSHRRLLRLMGLLIFLTMAGTLVFLMVTAFSSRDLSSLLLLALMGVIILPTMALLGGLIWYLDRWHARCLSRAHQLLQQNQPLTVRLTPVRSAGRDVLFALHPLASESLIAEPIHVLINASLHGRYSPQSAITVQMYCQKLAPGHDLVALPADGHALIGKVVVLEAYYRQRRKKMAVAIAFLAIVSALVILQKLEI